MCSQGSNVSSGLFPDCVDAQTNLFFTFCRCQLVPYTGYRLGVCLRPVTSQKLQIINISIQIIRFLINIMSSKYFQIYILIFSHLYMRIVGQKVSMTSSQCCPNTFTICLIYVACFIVVCRFFLKKLKTTYKGTNT